MKIALSIICRDDSQYNELIKALASCAQYVDSIYITTTGEKTEKIKSLPSINHSHMDWCDDFSKIRNYNFSQIKDEDYIFWIDSDDIVIGADKLRKIAERAYKDKIDVVFFDYWYACTFKGEPSPKNLIKVDVTHKRERLLRNHTHVWKGKLHETPIPAGATVPKYTSVSHEEAGIAVMHTITAAQSLGKMERNKRILEKQLEEEKEAGEVDPRTLIYLMRIYIELEDEEYWGRLISMGWEYLSKSGWNEERAVAYELMARAYLKMGDSSTAYDLLLQSVKEFPKRPLSYILMASACFNLKKYADCKHWLDVSTSFELPSVQSGIQDIQIWKLLYATTAMLYYDQIEKNHKKAYEMAKIISDEDPRPENFEVEHYLEDKYRLNEACKNIDALFGYLADIGKAGAIPHLIKSMPQEIKILPFIADWRNKTAPPRKWAKDEICVYASFGGKHFEEWDGNSLKKGIGGSETAVIELAQEWVKMGYKVVVYGDPGMPQNVNGVLYLPWYEFNIRDYFNIFIQWRNWSMASVVKARKVIIDLHDLFTASAIHKESLEAADAFMVKSQYHKSLAEDGKEKFIVVSNGIRV